MFLTIRRFFCSHTVFIEDLHRCPDGLVEAPCNRCGKVLRAECGLYLKAKLQQRPKVPTCS